MGAGEAAGVPVGACTGGGGGVARDGAAFGDAIAARSVASGAAFGDADASGADGSEALADGSGDAAGVAVDAAAVGEGRAIADGRGFGEGSGFGVRVGFGVGDAVADASGVGAGVLDGAGNAAGMVAADVGDVAGPAAPGPRFPYIDNPAPITKPSTMTPIKIGSNGSDGPGGGGGRRRTRRGGEPCIGDAISSSRSRRLAAHRARVRFRNDPPDRAAKGRA